MTVCRINGESHGENNARMQVKVEVMDKVHLQLKLATKRAKQMNPPEIVPARLCEQRFEKDP